MKNLEFFCNGRKTKTARIFNRSLIRFWDDNYEKLFRDTHQKQVYYGTSKEVTTLRQQQWYLETYQRRENLRFHGIPERLDEQENTRDVLVNFMINELNLEDAPQIEFQRVHRVGRFDASQHNPRQIIARFLRYGDREKVFSQARQLKGTGMGISPDLPKGVVDIRKKQIETLKKAKKDGKRAYFSRAEPDKLYVEGQLIPVSE